MCHISTSRPQWTSEGKNWPNREHCRFVDHAGFNWHYQRAGKPGSPSIALIHGTGAASHSFGQLLPRLAPHFDVLTFDLPGHGFTSAKGPIDLSLKGMALSISSFFSKLGFEPKILLGHSAGAAIAIEIALRKDSKIERVIGINAALQPIKGNSILSPMAKLLFANSLTSRMFSFTASQTSLGQNLLSSTGSDIGKEERENYAMLLRYPDHVQGALGMMASWNLDELYRRMPELKAALTLIVAHDDRMVPPAGSKKSCERVPDARFIEHPVGGHLLHESKPDLIVEDVLNTVKNDMMEKA